MDSRLISFRKIPWASASDLNQLLKQFMPLEYLKAIQKRFNKLNEKSALDDIEKKYLFLIQEKLNVIYFEYEKIQWNCETNAIYQNEGLNSLSDWQIDEHIQNIVSHVPLPHRIRLNTISKQFHRIIDELPLPEFCFSKKWNLVMFTSKDSYKNCKKKLSAMPFSGKRRIALELGRAGRRRANEILGECLSSRAPEFIFYFNRMTQIPFGVTALGLFIKPIKEKIIPYWNLFYLLTLLLNFISVIKKIMDSSRQYALANRNQKQFQSWCNYFDSRVGAKPFVDVAPSLLKHRK